MTFRLVVIGLAVLCVAAGPVWGEKLADGRLSPREDHQPAIATSAGIFSQEPAALGMGGGRLQLLDIHPGGPVAVRPATGPQRALDCGVSSADLAARDAGGRTHVLVVHRGGDCRLDGHGVARSSDPPSLLVLEVGSGAVASRLPLPDPTPVVVLHPSGRWAYVPTAATEQRRGQLHVIDVRDLDKVRLEATVPLATGRPSPSLAVDPDGSHLYAAAGTHTLSLDLADPSRPVIEGRIFDYMVRNHAAVAVTDVVDDFWGRRRFLTVTARLGGGAGCQTGTLFVYDITGDLRTRPLMVAEADIPTQDEHGWDAASSTGRCPVARAALDPQAFRLRIGWTLDDGTTLRRDWFAYDTTAVFQDNADYCTLVPV